MTVAKILFHNNVFGYIEAVDRLNNSIFICFSIFEVPNITRFCLNWNTNFQEFKKSRNFYVRAH